jgi:hypothetical protein
MDPEELTQNDTTLDAQPSTPDTDPTYDYDATWGIGDETMRLPR